DNKLFLREIGEAIKASDFTKLATGGFTGTVQAVVPLRNGAASPDVDPNPALLANTEAWISLAGQLIDLPNGFDFQNLAKTAPAIHHTGPAGQPGKTGVDDPLQASDMTGGKIKLYAYNAQ